MIGEVLQFRDLGAVVEVNGLGLPPSSAGRGSRNIRVQYDGQGGIWTTTAALNEGPGPHQTCFRE